MKTKLLLLSVVAAISVAALSLGGCTVSQAVASANYVAGAQFVTVALSNHSDASPALQNLANRLPDIISGKVSAYDLGALNKQLQPIFVEAEQTHPENQRIYVQIGSLIASASKLNGTNPTAYQGLVIAAAIDFQNGMNDGLQFNAGRQSVTDPPAVVAATSTRRAAVRKKS